ncbi:E3 ubiquitin-protein ligase upl3 [Phtheirospermum japonicum]|uniref:E3 ubiquitin-protein ligase upl3 n=1 Tax=Phtheirospermum japonicum TaxID=374723 RepID=A0A830CJI1_9LAMI|nr:E3 ubiquitin-protein ligase upl3 [Phtheirospermum japonicum]
MEAQNRLDNLRDLEIADRFSKSIEFILENQNLESLDFMCFTKKDLARMLKDVAEKLSSESIAGYIKYQREMEAELLKEKIRSPSIKLNLGQPENQILEIDFNGPEFIDRMLKFFLCGGKQTRVENLMHFASSAPMKRHDDDEGDDDDDDDYFGFFGSKTVSEDDNDVYTLTYRTTDQPSKNSFCSSSYENTTMLNRFLHGLYCEISQSNPAYKIVVLLQILEALNQVVPHLRMLYNPNEISEGKLYNLGQVPQEDFVNDRLTRRLQLQFQKDRIALFTGVLPRWCYQLLKSCPFLLSFEIRCQYIYSTAFGLRRALYWHQKQHGVDETELGPMPLQRQKARISRYSVLEYAESVLKKYSGPKYMLETTFLNEVGSGVGPTLEFYTLVCQELQKSRLNMWRECLSADGARRVNVQEGLFPRPWQPDANDLHVGELFSCAIRHFELLGRVVAKALQDKRILDLPLSIAFCKIILGHALEIHDILSFDLEFGKHLLELADIVRKLESKKKKYEPEDLYLRGTPIEDLHLDFSLPGYDDFLLRHDGDTVNLNNLGEYLSLVVDATIGSGIAQQINVFRHGFDQVFDSSVLQIFTPIELEYFLCGEAEKWTFEVLMQSITFGYGYTETSPAAINLIEVLCEFSPKHKRAFLQFVTGAPRLPPGGLRALNPQLTLALKTSFTGTSGNNNDNQLPSAFTCFNQLKLPSYSSKEILYKNLMYAITEGQGSFDFS